MGDNELIPSLGVGRVEQASQPRGQTHPATHDQVPALGPARVLEGRGHLMQQGRPGGRGGLGGRALQKGAGHSSDGRARGGIVAEVRSARDDLQRSLDNRSWKVWVVVALDRKKHDTERNVSSKW